MWVLLNKQTQLIEIVQTNLGTDRQTDLHSNPIYRHVHVDRVTDKFV